MCVCVCGGGGGGGCNMLGPILMQLSSVAKTNAVIGLILNI